MIKIVNPCTKRTTFRTFPQFSNEAEKLARKVGYSLDQSTIECCISLFNKYKHLNQFKKAIKL